MEGSWSPDPAPTMNFILNLKKKRKKERKKEKKVSNLVLKVERVSVFRIWPSQVKRFPTCTVTTLQHITHTDTKLLYCTELYSVFTSLNRTILHIVFYWSEVELYCNALHICIRSQRPQEGTRIPLGLCQDGVKPLPNQTCRATHYCDPFLKVKWSRWKSLFILLYWVA